MQLAKSDSTPFQTEKQACVIVFPERVQRSLILNQSLPGKTLFQFQRHYRARLVLKARKIQEKTGEHRTPVRNPCSSVFIRGQFQKWVVSLVVEFPQSVRASSSLKNLPSQAGDPKADTICGFQNPVLEFSTTRHSGATS
jgi:alpha-acetolactate decarboxylase